MVNPGEATDGMLNSFQIDVSERNSTEPFAQPWEMSIHPWGSSVSVISPSVYVCLSVDITRFLLTHTHIVTPYPQITLQLLSSVSKNISNYCFKCSSITECQVSSVFLSFSHTHTHAHTVSVCICEERWMKLRWSIAKHRDWIESMLQCSGFL